MVLSGFHKWMGLFVAIFVATALLCTPADAKSNSSSKESHKTSSKTTKKEKSAKKKNAKKSKKVKINEDDPKAFTKALLADKEGVEYEIVESKKKKNARKKKAEQAQDIGETLTFRRCCCRSLTKRWWAPPTESEATACTAAST